MNDPFTASGVMNDSFMTSDAGSQARSSAGWGQPKLWCSPRYVGTVRSTRSPSTRW
jgi:hypothetical protein